MGYIFKKLAQKLVQEREKRTSATTNPIENENVFLNKMTHSALNMYERKCDVKNFSKLVLSNPENDSHNKIMDELFSKGIKDPFENEKLFELSNNKKFLKDLGLMD